MVILHSGCLRDIHKMILYKKKKKLLKGSDKGEKTM